jgi:aspartokinase
MSLSEATRRALEKYPYLDRYISLGVVNNRGLARLILPDLTREFGTQPNIQSVVTAVRRIKQHAKRPREVRLERILSKSGVSLEYDMAAVTVSVGHTRIDNIKKRLLQEGTYILLQGIENLTIVADEASIKKIKEKLGKGLLEINPNLAMVVVKSPKEITKTPGVLAYLANILSIERINIVEMMSSHAETAFIVAERDALLTVDVLRREIKRSRKHLNTTSTVP